MITHQKVSGCLRRAKLTMAKFKPGGMVRGYGFWDAGLRVRQFLNVVFVEYEEDSGKGALYSDQVKRQRHAKAIDQARDALLAAGFTVKIERLETSPRLEVSE